MPPAPAAQVVTRPPSTPISYLGESDTVIVDVPASGSTVKAAIDSLGDRLATSAGAGFGWLVADIHGNVAARALRLAAARASVRFPASVASWHGPTSALDRSPLE